VPCAITDAGQVVLAVMSLYYYLAPPAETATIVRAMVRIAKGPPEIQYVALANIATMAQQRPVRAPKPLSRRR
jgi:hypothetical protein